jgi:hypothetical protein
MSKLDNQRWCLANFQAAFAGWQDFAGIQAALIVKQLLESGNQVQCVVGKEM